MSVNDPLSQPLMRVRQGKLIAGVCGGIAKWLGWDPTLVRLGYVVLTVLSVGFPGILMYILLWILMPQEPVYNQMVPFNPADPSYGQFAINPDGTATAGAQLASQLAGGSGLLSQAGRLLGNLGKIPGLGGGSG